MLTPCTRQMVHRRYGEPLRADGCASGLPAGPWSPVTARLASPLAFEAASESGAVAIASTSGTARRESTPGSVIAPTNPHASAAQGNARAETPTPSGSADCRTPMASPRSPCANQIRTRRPLAALTGPPTAPRSNRTTAALHSSDTVQSRPSAPAVRVRLSAIVERSPTRSITTPHARSVSSSPNEGSPASTPA